MPRKTSKLDASGLTVEEKILQDVHKVYTDKKTYGYKAAEGEKDEGVSLEALMKDIDPGQDKVKVLVPRKRVNVMLVGNHSAGKSSFINWYTGEDIQSTGVAIETSGFTVVHSGKRRETWGGSATLNYFKCFEGIEELKLQGQEESKMIHNINTEIVNSKERHFTSVNFIDSPGLVDGDMEYPYPVEDAIMFLAEHCDLIFIFLDPQGQAMVKRTMDVVESLNKSANQHKLQYYLSQADRVPDQNDRQQLIQQIAVNLAPKIQNNHQFKLNCIYVPTLQGKGGGEGSEVDNQIEDLCELIETTIGKAVQNSLDNMKRDCNRGLKEMAAMRELDEARKVSNKSVKRRKLASFLVFSYISLFLPFCIMLNKVDNGWGIFDSLDALADKSAISYDDTAADALENVVLGSVSFAKIVAGSDQQVLVACAVVFITYYILNTKLGLFFKLEAELSQARIGMLSRYEEVCKQVLVLQRAWYTEYQKQSTSAE